jgi:DNA replication and repair protein RecF
MPFFSLSCTNYRNLAEGPIDIFSGEIFFTGENGQGKSNILEALYILAYGSSFRTRNDGDWVRYGEKECSLRAVYRAEQGASHSVSVYYRNGKKRIEKNGKRIMDRKELIDTIPCVLYCHEDLEFVTGEPERRRFFLDQTLSMNDPVFIDLSRQYKKTLKSRNLILRSQQLEVLSAYNQQLVKIGVEIQQKRKLLVFSFNRIFSCLYEQVTGIDGVKLIYLPSWKETGEQPVSAGEALGQLEARQLLDLQFGTTMSGPHRDRILFIRNGRQFIPDASTGQKRLAAILLRSAQAMYYHQICGKKPVLLMDDVLLELDPEKRRRVRGILPEYDQLLCTFLIGEPYERYRTPATREYRIQEGRWEELPREAGHG